MCIIKLELHAWWFDDNRNELYTHFHLFLFIFMKNEKFLHFLFSLCWYWRQWMNWNDHRNRWWTWRTIIIDKKEKKKKLFMKMACIFCWPFSLLCMILVKELLNQHLVISRNRYELLLNELQKTRERKLV